MQELVVKPEETLSGGSDLQKALEAFKEAFSKEEHDKKYYHLVISNEYTRETCDLIEKAYLEGGWGKAHCRTSSENNERPGLTGLQLWRDK